MPRWFASTSRRRSLDWPAVGLVFGGMSLVETAIDTVYDYGMVTALPGVAVGLLLALCPRWPASAAVLGSLTVLANYALGTPGPGGAQLIGRGIHVGHAAAVLTARRGAVIAVVATLVVLVSGFAYIPSPWEGFFYLLVTGAAWGVGTLVRQTQERSRELQVLAAKLAWARSSATARDKSRIKKERSCLPIFCWKGNGLPRWTARGSTIFPSTRQFPCLSSVTRRKRSITTGKSSRQFRKQSSAAGSKTSTASPGKFRLLHCRR